jgi:hypothetical protein
MYSRIILWGRFGVLFGNVLTVTLEMIVNSQSSQHGCFPDYEVKCWKAMQNSQIFGANCAPGTSKFSPPLDSDKTE